MFAAWRGNFFWILFALVLSIILWAVISVQEDPYRDDVVQNVTVDVQNIPTGLISTGSPSTVTVKVSASVEAWRSLQASDIHAYVDASRVASGRQELPIKVESSDWRVTVQQWQPATVEVQFEPVGKRDVPVKVNVIGEAPFGYVAKQASVSPQQVTVTGPDSLVSQVVSVSVDVKLLDAKSTVSQHVRPVPIGSDGNELKGVTIVPDEVAVEVPIEQQVGYKTVAVMPRIVGSVGLGYQLAGVMVEPTVVTVVGDPNVLSSINYISTLPVNVNGAVADTTVNTDLDLPSSVSVVRQQGVVVRAYVSAAEGSQVFTAVPIVTGLSSKRTATFTPSTVQVTVSGSMPILATLKAKDVQVVIDASDLGPGTYELPLEVTVPDVLSADRVDPAKVTLTIK